VARNAGRLSLLKRPILLDEEGAARGERRLSAARKFMGQIIDCSAHYRLAAIGTFATRLVPIPVEMIIMLAYRRDKWSCDRARIRYRRPRCNPGQLKAGKMVDQSAEITSIFPYLVQ
jgi:hypothetical protein